MLLVGYVTAPGYQISSRENDQFFPRFERLNENKVLQTKDLVFIIKYKSLNPYLVTS